MLGGKEDHLERRKDRMGRALEGLNTEGDSTNEKQTNLGASMERVTVMLQAFPDERLTATRQMERVAKQGH